jgi:hypothetical protein
MNTTIGILSAVRKPDSEATSVYPSASLAVGRERIWRWFLKVMGGRAERSAFLSKDGGPLRPHFQRIVESFFAGYRAALNTRSISHLKSELSRIEPGHRGFAFEGAGMALMALDVSTRSDARRFREAVHLTPSHIYLLHVGAGWAFARSRRLEKRTLDRFDPVLRWLIIDGIGFYEGYFGRSGSMSTLRQRLSPAGARAFDQGLGRSLWFTAGADPAGISAAIDRFGGERHRDLWSGVGLAAAYAGGAEDCSVASLRHLSGRFHLHLAQGVAFAAEAHLRACNQVPPYTEMTCRLVCDLSAAEAASLTRHAALRLPGDGVIPAYEVWRSRLRQLIAHHLFRVAGADDDAQPPGDPQPAGKRATVTVCRQP